MSTEVVTMETKPAFLTTEFWLTVFGLLVNFVNIAGIWDWASNWHSGILVTVITAAYAVARGQAKSRTPYTVERNR